jgi:ribose transport system substrate-binding protein
MKKLVLLLTVFLLAASMAVFAGGNKESAGEGNGAETQSQEEKDTFTIGYASMGDVNAFHALVSQGFKQEAENRGYDLIKVDNDWNSETTVKNIDELISQNVDIIICGLSDSAIVPVIKQKVDAAGIPLVLIDNKQPGIPMFGGSNVKAGKLGGEWLGKKAVEEWGGEVDLYIGLEFPTAGELNELRMKEGFIAGVKEHVDLPDDKIVRLAGNNDIALSQQVTLDTITAHPDAERILIGCITDDCAQGALAAVEKLGYKDKVFICGQGFYDEVSAGNFQKANPTAWGATVAYWPKKYAYFIFEEVGPFLENGDPLPEEWNVKHVVVTRENVDDILAGKVD